MASAGRGSRVLRFRLPDPREGQLHRGSARSLRVDGRVHRGLSPGLSASRPRPEGRPPGGQLGHGGDLSRRRRAQSPRQPRARAGGHRGSASAGGDDEARLLLRRLGPEPDRGSREALRRRSGLRERLLSARWVSDCQTRSRRRRSGTPSGPPPSAVSSRVGIWASLRLLLRRPAPRRVSGLRPW